MNGIDTNLGKAQPTIATYPGKYPAIVLEDEPEDAALARGELLVQVPGILEETEDGSGQQPIKVLARPSMPPGFYFVPAAGARIWVEFAAGDINTPLWTSVWYPDDAAPQTYDGAAPARAQQIIRTPRGHVLQLDDAEGDEKIVIHHKDGITINIAADKTITITADTIKLHGAVQITGALTVGSGPSTKIEGNEITGSAGG